MSLLLELPKNILLNKSTNILLEKNDLLLIDGRKYQIVRKKRIFSYLVVDGEEKKVVEEIGELREIV